LLGTANPVTDLNCDGITNIIDVFMFKAMFRTAPGPSGALDPTPGDLVITEIMNNPVGTDTNGEWFEFFNPTGRSFDLQGLTVRDLGNDEFQINSSLVIPAGGFVVLGTNADFNTNGGVNVDYEYTNFILANSTDEIEIRNGASSIDLVKYDSGFPTTSGAAKSLDPAYFDTGANDDGANWCDAINPLPGFGFGSPGAANPSCP